MAVVELEISSFPSDWSKAAFAAKGFAVGVTSGSPLAPHTILAGFNLAGFAIGQSIGQPSGADSFVVSSASPESVDLAAEASDVTMSQEDALGLIHVIADHDRGTEGVLVMGSTAESAKLANLSPLEWLAFAKAIFDFIRLLRK